MFEHLLNPRPVRGKAPAHCTRKASAILRHSADPKPIVACSLKSGAKAYLCSACHAALNAERWALRMGVSCRGEQELAALAAVLESKAGYEPPPFSLDKRANNIWHALNGHASAKLVRKVRRSIEGQPVARILWAARDACLDCLSRGEHADDCGLTFGEAFAEKMRQRAR